MKPTLDQWGDNSAALKETLKMQFIICDFDIIL